MTGEQPTAGYRRPPAAGTRAGSALLTGAISAGLGLAAGVAALVVVGAVTILVMWVTGHSLDTLALGNITDPNLYPVTAGGKPPIPAWVITAVLFVSVLAGIAMAVVGGARFGHGTVGDGMSGVEVLHRDGTVPGRGLVLVRHAIPVATVVVVGTVVSWPLALLVLLVLTLPVLLPDRRSLVDRVLGLQPTIEVVKLGRPMVLPPRSD